VDEILNQTLGNPIVSTIGMALAGAMVALWVAAAWWAYGDAARRTGNTFAALVVAAWIVASTPLLLVLSLPVYMLVRPQDSAAERRTRGLAAELVDVLEARGVEGCFNCTNAIEPGWHRCPSCTTWLELPCASCAEWSDRTLAICPYCGGEERAEPQAESLEPAAAMAATRHRRDRRQPRAAGLSRQPAPRSGQRRGSTPEGHPLAPVRVG